jgi:DNA-binding LacI/PurR family transcriptional regulator
LVDAPDVDAILYASDEMAIGGLHALKEHGREVPTDVAVIGFHNMHAAQFTDPPLTSVEVDLRQMGQIAGQRLYHLALDASQARSVQPPWTVLVPTTLVVRRSA